MSRRNTPLTDNNIDSVVLNTLKNNKFSSVSFISYITSLSEKTVSDSFDRLLSINKIFLSVGGVPKRYSHHSERKNNNDDNEDEQLNKEEQLNKDAYTINPSPLLQGTVVH